MVYDLANLIEDAKRADENLTAKEILKIIEQQEHLIESQTEQIKSLNEHIENLYSIIYKIAPDMEIIETMAETEDEEQAYIDKYMNHGEYLQI